MEIIFNAVIGKYKRFIWRVLVLIWYNHGRSSMVMNTNSRGFGGIFAFFSAKNSDKAQILNF